MGETAGGPDDLGRPGRVGAHVPAVAVVTITKDDPAGIRKTIRSVAEQDVTDYEHVVLDGGTDAGAAAFLRQWQAADPERRRLVEDPPRGIYPSMNEGLRRTCAPLVLVLNGGDELASGALSAVLADRAERTWGWAFGSIQGKDEKGRLQDVYGARPFSRSLLRAGLQPVPHQASYVARELYDRVGPYREDLGTAADQELFLRLASVQEPAQLDRTLALVETWGISNLERPLDRELVWHRLRLASGTEFGGPTGDLAVTGLLLLRVTALRAVSLGRRLGRRAQRGGSPGGRDRSAGRG